MTLLLSSLIALTVTLFDARGEERGRTPSLIAKIEVSDYYVNAYRLKDKMELVMKGLAKIVFPGKDMKDLRVEVTE